MNSELVGLMHNTERMMFNLIHNLKIPSKMSYLLYISPLARIAEIMLGNYSLCQNHRMFGYKNSLSCHMDFVVNQICHFASTKKKKRSRNFLLWPDTGIPRNNLCHSCLLPLPFPVLLYGSETWRLTKLLIKKLQRFVSKCLRMILNIRWPEVISK